MEENISKEMNQEKKRVNKNRNCVGVFIMKKWTVKKG